MNPALLSSDLEHWLTPPDFSALVVKAMGGIDQDPASNHASLVPANDSFYREERDGLLVPWRGRIYVNPPYGTKIPLWVERMHVTARRIKTVTAMIGLLPARVDTEWCQRHVLESCDAFLMWSGRITFWRSWTDEQLSELVKALGFRPPQIVKHPQASTWVGPNLDKQGRPSPAPFPSLVPYWGDDVVRFGKTFLPYGTLVVSRGPKAGVYPRKAA